MKVVRRSPNKLWVFAGGKAFVLRIGTHTERLEKEIRLIPRWRVCSSLAFSSFASGVALVNGSITAGAILGAMALVCLWAASR